jgi:hypothetical protein
VKIFKEKNPDLFPAKVPTLTSYNEGGDNYVKVFYEVRPSSKALLYCTI